MANEEPKLPRSWESTGKGKPEKGIPLPTAAEALLVGFVMLSAGGVLMGRPKRRK
tara:strand:+ start:2299 stop:2463 length:165 start_codon:yes stop_codon:yes gene_type:complete